MTSGSSEIVRTGRQMTNACEPRYLVCLMPTSCTNDIALNATAGQHWLSEPAVSELVELLVMTTSGTCVGGFTTGRLS